MDEYAKQEIIEVFKWLDKVNIGTVAIETGRIHYATTADPEELYSLYLTNR